MLPKSIKPMLAVSAPAPFDSDDHLFEIKWDGIRCLAFVEKGTVRLQSRELVDITDKFPELRGMAALPSGTVLDGELVIFNEVGPCRSRVIQRLQLADEARTSLLSVERPAVFIAFDLLCSRGRSTMAEPLSTRRAMLEELLASRIVEQSHLSEAVRGRGQALFDQVSSLRWEGIMAKSIHGRYAAGRRTTDWQKMKLSATHNVSDLSNTTSNKNSLCTNVLLYSKTK